MASSEHEFAQMGSAVSRIAAQKCIMYEVRENSC